MATRTSTTCDVCRKDLPSDARSYRVTLLDQSIQRRFVNTRVFDVCEPCAVAPSSLAKLLDLVSGEAPGEPPAATAVVSRAQPAALAPQVVPASQLSPVGPQTAPAPSPVVAVGSLSPVPAPPQAVPPKLDAEPESSKPVVRYGVNDLVAKLPEGE